MKSSICIAVLCATVNIQATASDVELDKIAITSAVIGWGASADVTKVVGDHCNGTAYCRFQLDGSVVKADPVPGVKKKTVVAFSCGNSWSDSTSAMDQEWIEIDCRKMPK